MTPPAQPRRGWKLPAQPRIAVVGARGLVGKALLAVLHQREFPHQGVAAMRVGGFCPQKVADADLIFLAGPASLAHKFARELTSETRVVIDLSEAWRMDPSVPLVLDGLNLDDVHQHQGLISSPNCTNGGLLRVLDILRRDCTLGQVVVTTFQAASGGGRKLLQSIADTDDPLHANVIPQCDAFAEDGATLEEHRVVAESLRLLEDASLNISATCVRVPVEVGHGLSVWIEASEDFDLTAVAEKLRAEDGMVLSHSQEDYPTPKQIRGKEGVFLGRLRHGAKPNQLQLWIVTDNLLTGAASNAVAIAEALLPS
ncbi:MAG: hypothetical protein COA70_12785 [Planctomycetota bacterium]|nr:MAG: hypothetical protein COA70_12785 [Planctomycetota bacterium]